MPDYKLTREEIFGGKVIAPMRKWLKKQGKETKGYPYTADMAIITHYLQNKDVQAYRELAIPRMQNYYRALYSLDMDAPVNIEDAEAIFAAVEEAPVRKRHKDNNSFTFVDLFAGIGGFRIALEQLGGKCVYASEFNAAAQKSYGMNHGVVPFGDITQPDNKDLIPNNVDVLCAGFPCQPFSSAGLRLGFSDKTKGTLFYELKEIVREKRPRIILFENVLGLMTIHNRDEEGNVLPEKTIDTILDILRDDLHYHVPYPEVRNACHFGVPQNRERVFIVGFRDTDADNYLYPTGEGIPDKFFGEIRSQEMVGTEYYLSDRYWKTLKRHKEEQKNKGRGYGYRIVRDNEFGHTLMLGGMGLERNLVEDPLNPFVETMIDPRGQLNNECIRVLTEYECRDMQGFPPYYEIHVPVGSARNQFGNSIAIPVVKEIARTLLDYEQIPYNEIN